MSHLTTHQDIILKKVIKAVLDGNVNDKTVSLIKEHELMEAINTDGYIARIKNDVMLSATDDNGNMPLTENQIEEVTRAVESNYDHSYYDDFISDTIEEVLAAEKQRPYGKLRPLYHNKNNM